MQSSHHDCTSSATLQRDAQATADGGWSSFRAVWWVVAAGALAGSLGEAGLILGARVALHRYAMFNPQGLWLAPIANVLLLIVPCVLVWLVARRWSAKVAVAGVAFCAALVAALEPLMVLQERIHPFALLLLAAGFGSQVARFAMARPAAFATVTRRVTLGFFAVSASAGIGFNGLRWFRESRALSRLGNAADGAPNVLLLVLDTVRAASLSAYGYTRATSPFLSELAARGVRFDQAIAPAPWTLASHASMFTGRYPHELSIGWSVPLDDREPTLAERLGQQGYATYGVAANLHYCSYEFGIDRGFARYRDYDISLSEMLRTSSLSRTVSMAFNRYLPREFSPGRQSATRINERLLDLIASRGQRPFFAFANYYDAHGPYTPPAPYDTLFLGRQATNRDPAPDDLNAAQVSDLQAAYDASIASLDAQLRDLFAALESRGLLKNTLVVVTSDHGEEFNEHGLLNHGSSLYLPSVHVPLLVLYPGVVPAGQVVKSPVTLRDLGATILDLTRAPESARLPGQSMVGLWRQTAPDSLTSPLIAEVDFARNLPAQFAVSKGDMKSEILDGFRYILNGDGRGELYDLRTDPMEQRDLVSAPVHSARAQELRQRVQSITRGPRKP